MVRGRVALLALLVAGGAQAIYKCATPNGTVYQDRPCATGSQSEVGNTHKTQSAPTWSVDAQRKKDKAEHDVALQALKDCQGSRASCSSVEFREAMGHVWVFELEATLGKPSGQQLLGDHRYVYWTIPVVGGRARFQVVASSARTCYDEITSTIYPTDVCQVNVSE